MNTTPPTSATIKVTPRIVDHLVEAHVEILEPFNVRHWSVDLAFPPGLKLVSADRNRSRYIKRDSVNQKHVRDNVIREITKSTVFKFEIYEGGELEFVLQNGELISKSGNTVDPILVPGVIAVVASPRWDVDRNYKVNLFDFRLLVEHFDERIPLHARPNPDVSRDGLVNLLDFVKVGGNFSKMYSPIPGVPTAPAMPLASLNLGEVDSAYLPFFRQMAIEMENHPLADTREFMRARMLLDKLTIAKAPEETRLLSNFPNPFNPETWIPFELARPSDVTVSIYNPRGQLVRTLVLGELQAGNYNDRSSAVYWDGRSETGESVSSGLYFYHLKAENFSATRQMVIMK